jgi:hypothetical protein
MVLVLLACLALVKLIDIGVKRNKQEDFAKAEVVHVTPPEDFPPGYECGMVVNGKWMYFKADGGVCKLENAK